MIDDLLAIGKTITLGAHTFGSEEIKRFASSFDPQRFHVDEEAAKDTIFGRLCASGWHTVSMWMRFNVLFGPEGEPESELERPSLRFGPSPGLRDLKWRRPVYTGDTITFTRTVTHCRSIPDRPGWFLVKNHCEAINQDGVRVMDFDSAVLVERL